MKIESNIWKFFVLILTGRRNYIPFLSIYYMMLPSALASDIGIFNAIGAFVAFLMEVPSGYFADRFGHKNTLILSKIFMFTSTLLFLIGGSLMYFILGSIFLSLGIAFMSGTSSAFFHETLDELGREGEFSKLMGKIKGNVSLISVFLIIALPFLTAINIKAPFAVSLFIDFVGIIIAFMLIAPKSEKNLKEKKSIFAIIKENQGQMFYPVAIFTSIISGFLIADSSFKNIYLVELGYPIILIGFVMGISRFFWYIIGNNLDFIKKHLSIKKMLFREIVIFTLYYVAAATIKQPYVLGLLFSLVIGYHWARIPIIEHYLIGKLPDKSYKATMLSVKSQVTALVQIVVGFGIGFVMTIDYEAGFSILGILLFLILMEFYFRIKD